MLRWASRAVLTLVLIAAPISSISAKDLEGMLGIAAVDAGTILGRQDRWDCDKPEGIARIRRIELCHALAAEAAAIESAPGLIRYRVLVEKGLERFAGFFVRRVAEVLGRETGWSQLNIRFVRVAEDYDITIVLAEPKSVDRLCRPLRTGGWLSCAIDGRAVINADRWLFGSDTWGNDAAGYHHYLINHEVGHLLGLRHLKCSGAGASAPIMLPQTRFLNGCVANGKATPQDLAALQRVLPYLERRISGKFARRSGRRRYSRRSRYRRRRHRRRRARLFRRRR